jgi:DNA-binding response OmpR family regulator
MRQKQLYIVTNYFSPNPIFSFPQFKSNFRKVQLSQPNTGDRTAPTKKRILLVDDEKDIANMFKSGLERNGFIVDAFSDPMRALSHFKIDHYDLLILDVRMPSMSGFELWSEIRKIDNNAKVCFISAFEIHNEELGKYFPDEGEKCVVKKPVSMKDLVRAINDEIVGH